MYRIMPLIIIIPRFHFMIYFNVLGKLSHFKQAAVTFFHFPPKVVHFKHAAIIDFSSHLIIGMCTNSDFPLQRGQESS